MKNTPPSMITSSSRFFALAHWHTSLLRYGYHFQFHGKFAYVTALCLAMTTPIYANERQGQPTGCTRRTRNKSSQMCFADNKFRWQWSFLLDLWMWCLFVALVTDRLITAVTLGYRVRLGLHTRWLGNQQRVTWPHVSFFPRPVPILWNTLYHITRTRDTLPLRHSTIVGDVGEALDLRTYLHTTNTGTWGFNRKFFLSVTARRVPCKPCLLIREVRAQIGRGLNESSDNCRVCCR